jgi:hypothetical protein
MTRICDVCGKTKSVEGGKTCEHGHFVCKVHLSSGVVFITIRRFCPMDGTRLR